MLDRVGEYAPDEPSHRLLTGYVLAVAGILAVGDGLQFIRFPLYTLGLPDTVLADTTVTLLGVGLFAVAYRLTSGTLGDQRESPESSDAALADGGTTTEGDPVTVLEHRYARGDIDDEEFERRKTMLEGDAPEDATDRQTQITQRDNLADRETTIE